MISRVLDEVRLTALKRMRKAKWSDKDICELCNAMSEMIILETIAKKNGLLGLEEHGKRMKPKRNWERILKRAIGLMVDGNLPEMVEEHLSNMFWLINPKGAQAFILYEVINEINFLYTWPNVKRLEQRVLSLLPPDICKTCYKRIEKKTKKYSDRVKKEEAKKFDNLDFAIADEETRKLVYQIEHISWEITHAQIDVWLNGAEEMDVAACMVGMDKFNRNHLLTFRTKWERRNIVSKVLSVLDDMMFGRECVEKKIKASAEKILERAAHLAIIGDLPKDIMERTKVG